MPKAPFRIAMRVEGEMWNAYFAPYDSMDDALLFGSIRIAAVHQDEELKELFMDLMKKVLESSLARVSDAKVVRYDLEKAPEHEKAGSS